MDETLDFDQRLALIAMLTDRHVSIYTVGLAYDGDDDHAIDVLDDLTEAGLAEPVPNDDTYYLTTTGRAVALGLITGHPATERPHPNDPPWAQLLYAVAGTLADALSDNIAAALDRVHADREAQINADDVEAWNAIDAYIARKAQK